MGPDGRERRFNPFVTLIMTTLFELLILPKLLFFADFMHFSFSSICILMLSLVGQIQAFACWQENSIPPKVAMIGRQPDTRYIFWLLFLQLRCISNAAAISCLDIHGYPKGVYWFRVMEDAILFGKIVI